MANTKSTSLNTAPCRAPLRPHQPGKKARRINQSRSRRLAPSIIPSSPSTTPSSPSTHRRTRDHETLAPKRKALINLTRGQQPYDVSELLSGKVPNITTLQLLSSTLSLRRELAVPRTSQPFTRKCKNHLVSHIANTWPPIATTAERDRVILTVDQGRPVMRLTMGILWNK